MGNDIATSQLNFYKYSGIGINWRRWWSWVNRRWRWRWGDRLGMKVGSFRSCSLTGFMEWNGSQHCRRWRRRRRGWCCRCWRQRWIVVSVAIAVDWGHHFLSDLSDLQLEVTAWRKNVTMGRLECWRHFGLKRKNIINNYKKMMTTVKTTYLEFRMSPTWWKPSVLQKQMCDAIPPQIQDSLWRLTRVWLTLADIINLLLNAVITKITLLLNINITLLFIITIITNFNKVYYHHW